MFLPGLHDQRDVGGYQLANLVELTAAEAVVPDYHDRLNPELADASITLNVHMHWLCAVEAVEVEPEGSGDATDGWQLAFPRYETTDVSEAMEARYIPKAPRSTSVRPVPTERPTHDLTRFARR